MISMEEVQTEYTKRFLEDITNEEDRMKMELYLSDQISEKGTVYSAMRYILREGYTTREIIKKVTLH